MLRNLAAVLAASVCLHASSVAQCELERLIPNDGIFLDLFGYSLSLEPTRVAIGAPHGETSEGGGEDPPGLHAGQVYLFELEGVEWVQKAKIEPFDRGDEDQFGFSVALSGERLIIGSRYDDDLGSKSGSAYVYNLEGGTWRLDAKLLASDGAANDLFGMSVALSGNRAVVASPGDDDGADTSGSLYVFERIGGVWEQTAKVGISPPAPFASLGRSVSMSGNRILAGATGFGGPGAAFVYEYNGSTWQQVARLISGENVNGFGVSAAIRGDQVVVGAPSFQNLALTGAAYVFEYVDGVWSKTAKLVAADAEPGDAAGISVALGKDRVLVGAHFDDDFTTSSGAAYLYVREPGGWTQVSKLTASDAATGDAFGNQYGIAVAISGNFGLVGSWGHDASGNDSGAAYFYALDGTPNPSLAGSVATVDVSDGGQQELRINACSQWGGYTYIVVGSASGTSPGSTVSGVYMPLNYDIYYRDTLSKPNTAPLVTSLGTLDAAGKATAIFTTEFGGAPGLVGLGQYGTTPGIVGLTLHHAYRVIDPNTLQVVFVSEPVPLQILP